jgi:putative transposase
MDYKIDFIYNNNHSKSTIGIDLGLKIYATQSDGLITEFPKQRIITLENKIKKLQQILSNKQYNSNNYKKLLKKLNKLYKKIHNITFNFLNKYTTWLCKTYSEIHIENLNIQSMLKNHRMSKAIQRSCFYTFRNMLEYKSKLYNCNLIIIDRYFASSKICHNCGNKKQKLKLSDRIYKCDKCGYEEDRDLNAALNIRDWK